MKAEFSGKVIPVLEKICEITVRRPDEMMADMIKTYLWILEHQTFGGEVETKNGNPELADKLANLVLNKKAAESFFKKRVSIAEPLPIVTII